MAKYRKQMSRSLYLSLKSLDPENDLHARTAEALIDRGFAKRVRVLPNKRVVCRVTKTGAKYGTGLGRQLRG